METAESMGCFFDFIPLQQTECEFVELLIQVDIILSDSLALILVLVKYDMRVVKAGEL